jgi:hypothetical protein
VPSSSHFLKNPTNSLIFLAKFQTVLESSGSFNRIMSLRFKNLISMIFSKKLNFISFARKFLTLMKKTTRKIFFSLLK